MSKTANYPVRRYVRISEEADGLFTGIADEMGIPKGALLRLIIESYIYDYYGKRKAKQ